MVKVKPVPIGLPPEGVLYQDTVLEEEALSVALPPLQTVAPVRVGAFGLGLTRLNGCAAKALAAHATRAEIVIPAVNSQETCHAKQ